MASDDQKKHQGIKAWSEEDRPREKMLAKGNQALTSSELIAILIGSGTKNESAVEVAQKLLKAANNDLNQLGQFSIQKISQTNGIGQAKAISIAAALELGRRRKSTEAPKRPKLTSSEEVHEFMAPYMEDLDHEQFYLLLLNRANEVLDTIDISKGGVSGTVVDPKLVFKKAVEYPASSIIICHNHPSGTCKPSEADISLTNQLSNAGSYLDIKLLDHLIFAGKNYYSFADNGRLG